VEGKKMIEVKNLTHVYENGIVAVKDVSLRIERNEVVGIIGQNGSGKTTLVKHFNALLKPTKGKVMVNGIDVSEKEPYEMAFLVGYIFQNPDEQIFSKTIEEEVEFGVRQIGKGDSEWALKTMGLWGVRKRNPYDFSYNTRKIIGIASIIAMRPEVIIFDEPTTGQDPDGIIQVEKLIKEMKGKHTIIVISHDIEFIARNCERVILMDGGEKIFDGKTRDVFYDDIERYGIEPPQIVQLSKRMGLGKILTVEEAYEKLMKRKLKKSINKIHELF
jgi:energy-coupling factor transport system ATP-binding protein